MPSRFAPILTTAEMIARGFERDREPHEWDPRPTDEMLFEALSHLDPPLLGEHDGLLVEILLSNRRGRRPKQALPPDQLAQHILQIERDDAPPAFLKALAGRLESGARFTELDRAKRDYKGSMWRRDDLMHGLYTWFYKDLGDVAADQHFIDHEVLGRVAIPLNVRGRSARALAMTHEVARTKLNLDPPAMASMMNVIYNFRRRKYGQKL